MLFTARRLRDTRLRPLPVNWRRWDIRMCAIMGKGNLTGSALVYPRKLNMTIKVDVFGEACNVSRQVTNLVLEPWSLRFTTASPSIRGQLFGVR